MKSVVYGKNILGILAASLIIIFHLPQSVFSQINVVTVAAPVNALSINDLDYLNSTTPKWLFTITMSAPAPTHAIMIINLDVQLASGAGYPEAAKFTSRIFSINGTRTITNLDLGKGRQIPDSMYEFKESAKSAFQNVALASGSMPAGTYTFRVDVRAVETGDVSGGGEFTFVLTNPSSPVLLAPAEGETIAEEFPLFEWQYDGTRATIEIFEMLSEQRSLEEAASGRLHATATVTTRSFRYPVSGARPLQAGKTYVWYVNGLIGAAGGSDLVLQSTIRSFSVSTQRKSSLAWILQELESALPPHYKPVFDQIRSQNFSPSGTYRLNGSPISITDLLNVLNEIRSNPESVSSVDLE